MSTTSAPERVYATRGLLEALLAFAGENDPESVTVSLVATPADDWADLPAGSRVFTDFYFPGAGDSIERVFGVDLGVPAGQIHGRFLSHPAGDLGVSSTDHFHARMLVAVPPWTADEVGAFDRSGHRLPLTVVDAAPATETLDD